MQYNVINTDGYKYDVPFVSVTANEDIYNLSRQFYCAQESSVDVRYYMVYCGTQNTDFLYLWLNDKFSIYTPATAGTTFNDLGLNETCNGQWYYTGEHVANIPFVTVGSLFSVVFEIRINGSNKAIAIRGIKIQCIQILQPSTKTTTSPTEVASTTISTEQPETAAPSQYPSKQPTHSPSTLSTMGGISNVSTPSTTLYDRVSTYGGVQVQETTKSDSNQNPQRSDDKSLISQWIYITIAVATICYILGGLYLFYIYNERIFGNVVICNYYSCGGSV